MAKTYDEMLETFNKTRDLYELFCDLLEESYEADYDYGECGEDDLDDDLEELDDWDEEDIEFDIYEDDVEPGDLMLELHEGGKSCSLVYLLQILITDDLEERWVVCENDPFENTELSDVHIVKPGSLRKVELRAVR